VSYEKDESCGGGEAGSHFLMGVWCVRDGAKLGRCDVVVEHGPVTGNFCS
jgi:hypothetical protein